VGDAGGERRPKNGSMRRALGMRDGLLLLLLSRACTHTHTHSIAGGHKPCQK
jgi:hypothetical protein